MKKMILIVILTAVSVYPQNPCKGTPVVLFGGKNYNTVQIGTQCWLKENINLGTMIDSIKNQTDNGIVEKYCYKNNLKNCELYGGLYQWAEAVQYQNGAENKKSANPAITGKVQGICPAGWHIPSFNEFQTLFEIVKGDADRLKSAGQGIVGNTGTNKSGFSALFAGFRDINNYFTNLGHDAYFWSSTEKNDDDAVRMFLYYNLNFIYWLNDIKIDGISVRCLKD